MFLSRKTKNPRPVVPLPDSEADGWVILESAGRGVFAVMCRDAHMDSMDDADSTDYEELFEEFRDDPQSVLRPAVSTPVASGIIVSAALLYVLPLTAWLLKVAAERAAGQAVDALGNATRAKLGHLLRRRRDDGAPEDAPDTAAGPGTDAVPDAGAGPDALDADEERAVLTALTAYAESLGADAAEAREVSEAIIRFLRGRGGGSSDGR
ncbi:hypothetical protein ABZ532_24245 [Streptomyces sp. NPDC019396]|uniref:hypothetical protein n=1 Tax=Streptomyces sp. NPDC019396 TaxID=3154687 RepID=UPI0033D20C96